MRHANRRLSAKSNYEPGRFAQTGRFDHLDGESESQHRAEIEASWAVAMKDFHPGTAGQASRRTNRAAGESWARALKDFNPGAA
jgi:hypothetical protein